MIPYLVVANKKGEIFEYPEYFMTGYDSLKQPRLPKREELIEAPFGTIPMILPHRKPIGFHIKKKKFEIVEKFGDEEIFAVSFFMPPAYTMTLRSAYKTLENAPILPLFAYTAGGWYGNTFWTTGVRIDPDPRQNPDRFNRKRIEKKAYEMLKKFPKNRLAKHLIENCCLEYCCPAAQNWVLNRWEAPLPTSPYCNARCIGCISHQPENTVPPTQYRIKFIPTVREIVEIAIEHLNTAPKPIVSFGQGCEGEPLLQAETIAKAIKEIRKHTDKGTININTNGAIPSAVERLCKSGIDSFRISLNSAQKIFYERYYNPINYTFEDVMESMKIIKKYDKWLSINYFIFPGFTDTERELYNLCKMMEKIKIDLIQMRNLNIDPEWYIKKVLKDYKEEGFGILNWMVKVKSSFPHVKFGYFNPYLKKQKGEKQ